MFRSFRPLAAAGALAAILALVNSAAAQKPFDDPVLERMRKDIFFLASPECEGRGIETKGIEKAAEYIVNTFQEAGLKPAMKDGSFFQPFTVKMDPAPARPTTFTLHLADGLKELKLDTEFAVMGASRTSKGKGDLVFAGFGITAPALKYDDYDGLNVEGKIVIVLRRTPRYGETGDKRFDTTIGKDADSTHAAFATKIALAVKNKAAALVIVNDTTAAGGAPDPLPKFGEYLGLVPAKIPVLMMKRATFDTILKGAGQKPLKELETGINDTLKPNSFELKGWSGDVVVTVEQPEVKCKNVIGVLEGAGPLANETIVIGAHYDHVGYGLWGSIGGPAAAGKIHYGADDNGSGTTGLMELARRFGAQKNRQGRRLVFIAFSGEEHGLDGSKFYCKEPLFPLDKTAAMINMDMIGRTKPVPTDWLGLFPKKDKLVVYGTGTGTGFDELAEETTKKADFRLFKVAASASNSDNDSFYRKKVPVLFLFTGLHGEYHRPTDVPEKIDVPGLKRVVDVAEMMAVDLAARATAPKYSVVRTPAPLDPSSPPPPEPKRMGTGPRLGILPSYSYEGAGVMLEGVSPGGAAEKAGLKENDVIVELAGKPVPNITAYMTIMGGQRAGTSIDIVVERGGKKLTLKADLK